MAAESHYRIAEAGSAWDLEAKVKELLDDGWVPQGGVAVAAGDGLKLFQAMTRDLKPPPPAIAVAQVAIPVGEVPPL